MPTGCDTLCHGGCLVCRAAGCVCVSPKRLQPSQQPRGLAPKDWTKSLTLHSLVGVDVGLWGWVCGYMCEQVWGVHGGVKRCDPCGWPHVHVHVQVLHVHTFGERAPFRCGCLLHVLSQSSAAIAHLSSGSHISAAMQHCIAGNPDQHQPTALVQHCGTVTQARRYGTVQWCCPNTSPAQMCSRG